MELTFGYPIRHDLKKQSSRLTSCCFFFDDAVFDQWTELLLGNEIRQRAGKYSYMLDFVLFYSVLPLIKMRSKWWSMNMLCWYNFKRQKQGVLLFKTLCFWSLICFFDIIKFLFFFAFLRAGLFKEAREKRNSLLFWFI